MFNFAVAAWTMGSEAHALSGSPAGIMEFNTAQEEIRGMLTINGKDVR